MIFDHVKKIELLPVGGLVNQAVNHVLKPQEATVALNCDYRGRAGGVMKAGDSEILLMNTISTPGIERVPLWLYKYPVNRGYNTTANVLNISDLGYDIYMVNGKIDEDGNVLPEFLKIGDAGIPSGTPAWFPYGLENLPMPDCIVRDPVEYTHFYKVDSLEFKKYRQYLYLFSKELSGTGETTAKSKVIFRLDDVDGSVTDYVYNLQPQGIPPENVTLTPQTHADGEMETGSYAYQFLFEDFAGNVWGTFYDCEFPEDARNHYYGIQTYPAFTGLVNNENSIKIHITIGSAIKNLRYLYIFRSEKQWFQSTYGDEPHYYLVEKIDFLKDGNTPFIYHDLLKNTDCIKNEAWQAYFNAGINPKEFVEPKQINTACIHQEVMYVAFRNKINYSLRNFYRNWKENDYIIIPEADNITALNSAKNRLEIFADNGIWVWYGQSPAQMYVNRPEKIASQGIPYYDVRDLKWNRTLQYWDDRTLFVDVDGYPMQLVNGQVIYLSSDGSKKIRIEGEQLDAVIINNEYRITNGSKEYVCHLGNGFAWSERNYTPQHYLK